MPKKIEGMCSSSNWPFADAYGYMILKCPSCPNRRIFSAAALQERLVWRCPECGNQLNLNLERVSVRYPAGAFDNERYQ